MIKGPTVSEVLEGRNARIVILLCLCFKMYYCLHLFNVSRESTEPLNNARKRIKKRLSISYFKNEVILKSFVLAVVVNEKKNI